MASTGLCREAELRTPSLPSPPRLPPDLRVPPAGRDPSLFYQLSKPKPPLQMRSRTGLENLPVTQGSESGRLRGAAGVPRSVALKGNGPLGEYQGLHDCPWANEGVVALPHVCAGVLSQLALRPLPATWPHTCVYFQPDSHPSLCAAAIDTGERPGRCKKPTVKVLKN